MKIDSLQSLFQAELMDLYDAEKRLVKALPKMAKSASSDALRSAIQGHLEQTRGHVTRLEEVFEMLGLPAKGKTCKAMKGLIDEGAEQIHLDAASGPLRDAAMIGAAQRVEHYEIAAYGTARAIADRLGQSRVVDLLQETLDEEGEADKQLTSIAERIYGELENVEPMRRQTGSTRRPKTRTSGA